MVPEVDKGIYWQKTSKSVINKMHIEAVHKTRSPKEICGSSAVHMYI